MLEKHFRSWHQTTGQQHQIDFVQTETPSVGTLISNRSQHDVDDTDFSQFSALKAYDCGQGPLRPSANVCHT